MAVRGGRSNKTKIPDGDNTVLVMNDVIKQAQLILT